MELSVNKACWFLVIVSSHREIDHRQGHCMCLWTPYVLVSGLPEPHMTEMEGKQREKGRLGSVSVGDIPT